MKMALNPLCERCEKINLIIPTEAVHHIIPISQGGDPWDLDNLESLCIKCHNKESGGKNKGWIKSANIAERNLVLIHV